ncbi:nitroreductase family protein [Sedimentibacter sp. zth1]|uniref:nitroreductase family protein n=1 Tax=Sedimentibacter sp. zth1 TaxID=2816908 RepID=UPI001A92C686|nr:nitroreductase family protein [Sedimentibacter sp. zth1]QSX06297.1 nitroreductase family protein [Sedimentibacter sp. zth1]
MNEIIKQLFDRKSVRLYDDKNIDDETKKLILQSAIQAPTAGNMSLYSIINITDQNIKDKLSVTCDNQPFIKNAKMVLIFCADYSRWYKSFCEVECQVRKPDAGDLLLAFSDALIAAQNTVVAAQSMGVGSCYVGDILENYEVHKEMLNLPKYVVPACLVLFGYPTEQQKSRVKPRRYKLEDIVCNNTYFKNNSNNQFKMIKCVTDKTDEEVTNFIKAICKRKWNCNFSKEMSRSVTEMINDWIE